MKEHIEQQVWEYIDGSCSEADKARIASLIAQDESWGMVYHELQELHTGIKGNMELEQPQVRFTKNVMDAIALTKPIPAGKTYINRTIIRSIAAFFMITITSVLLYAFATADWNAPSTPDNTLLSGLNIPTIKLSELLNPTYINYLIGINVILFLVFVDMALRRKRTQHQ